MLLTIWLLLFGFEVALFTSYTLLWYYYAGKVHLPREGPLPSLTLVVPMYNEVGVIREKVRNTAELDYPSFRTLFLDDHSTDGSRGIAMETIKETGLRAEVVESGGGKGKARAMNWLFPKLESEITVISDADATLKPDALKKVTRHFADPKVGGVSGKIVVVSDQERLSRSQEKAYRFFYDIWRRGESALHSISVCNGPLMSFRTALLKGIEVDPDTYADDSDILFKMVGKGWRVVYEPEAIAYERVPLSLKGRTIQKMKRINGLRGIYLGNLGLLGKGTFGKVTYPFALLTHVLSPLVLLLLLASYPLAVHESPVLLLLPAVFLAPKLGQVLSSFVITQLIMNFSFLVPTSGSWQALEDARYQLKEG